MDCGLRCEANCGSRGVSLICSRDTFSRFSYFITPLGWISELLLCCVLEPDCPRLSGAVFSEPFRDVPSNRLSKFVRDYLRDAACVTFRSVVSLRNPNSASMARWRVTGISWRKYIYVYVRDICFVCRGGRGKHGVINSEFSVWHFAKD